MPVINGESGNKSEVKTKYRKKDRKGIFTEEERQFLRGKASCQSNDDVCHNKKYIIRVKAKKAFKEDIPLILENAFWIFDGEEENFFEKRLFDNIKDLYIIHRNQLKQERAKAKVKSSISQKEIWKRVNRTIKEVRSQAQKFWIEVDNTP
jgi:hypothetical protein